MWNLRPADRNKKIFSTIPFYYLFKLALLINIKFYSLHNFFLISKLFETEKFSLVLQQFISKPILIYLKRLLIKKIYLFKLYLKIPTKNQYIFYLIQRSKRILQIS